MEPLPRAADESASDMGDAAVPWNRITKIGERPTAA